MTKNENVFVRISNKDIFTKLESIDDRLKEIEYHVKETNGKVKFNRKMIIGLISVLSIVVTEIVVNVILAGGLI